MRKDIRWVLDDEKDIGISFFDILILIKYKNGVIVQWFKKYYSAPKYWPGEEQILPADASPRKYKYTPKGLRKGLGKVDYQHKN